MANIQDWVEVFAMRHTKRYVRQDWPEAGSDEWADYVSMWIASFAVHRITEDEAETASLRLAAKPPRWRENHIPAVIEEVLAARPQTNGPIPSERATAEKESRDCKYCGGGGLVTAYHPKYAGAPTIEVTDHSGEVVRQAAAVACHCVCQHGRWIRANTAEEVRGRIVDADKIRQRQTRWTLKNPTTEAFTEEYGEITSVTELRAFTRHVSDGDRKGPASIGEILGERPF